MTRDWCSSLPVEGYNCKGKYLAVRVFLRQAPTYVHTRCALMLMTADAFVNRTECTYVVFAAVLTGTIRWDGIVEASAVDRKHSGGLYTGACAMDAARRAMDYCMGKYDGN